MNTLKQSEDKEMSPFKQWSILASNASLPWTIFIGLLAVGPIYSGNELITKLQENYRARAERVIKPNSNTTYQCGEGYVAQYICEDITEVVQRGGEKWNVNNIYKTRFVNDKLVKEIDDTTLQYIKTLFDTFSKQYPDNFKGELEVIGGLKTYDFKDPESISRSARESDIEAILLTKELESHIPKLKNQIKTRSKQEYLSEEDRNKFLSDLRKLGYSGVFDLDSITDFFLFTHTKFESQENQKLHSALFFKYFGEIKLNFSGDNIVGTYTGGSLKSPLYLLVLSLFTTLLYISIILPVSGKNKISKKLIVAEYGKIQNGVSSREELEEIDKYRKILGLQSHNDAVKMFNQLGLISNGKIITKKGMRRLVFLKKNGDIQGMILDKTGKYNYYGKPINDNLVLLYVLEENGFTIENIEIVTGDNIE
ncbi:MAG: hypothetical protein PHH70_01590 [Candidatus Gracilibacteria bacterium]|nr:hypothetical protein [Candidatus Gracilibacteria bacterium]